MHRRRATRIMGWIGLAALGALQYMGPRPLFVKTAYAAPVETAWVAVVTEDATPLAGDAAADRPACRMND